MAKVQLAVRYSPNALRPKGTQEKMLLRQYRFPYDYDETRDTLRTEHCLVRDPVPDYDFEVWIRSPLHTPRQIMTYLVKLLEEDPHVNWTGFRVCGRVTKGGIVWELELFFQDESYESSTRLYTDECAPNVISSGFFPFVEEPKNKKRTRKCVTS